MPSFERSTLRSSSLDIHPYPHVRLQLLESDLARVLLRASPLEIDVDGGRADLRSENQDEQGSEDEVEAAEAILEGHEGEVGLGGGQVHLGHVHVGRVEDQEHQGEGEQEAKVQ